MRDFNWIAEQAELTIKRLLPTLTSTLYAGGDARTFEVRLRRHLPMIFDALLDLYGDQYDFFFHLQQMLETTARMFTLRPAELHALDRYREQNPDWFQSSRTIGAVCYVDRFAGTLRGIRERAPYFDELGLTYLHLMPLFKSPEKNSDGGYAVSSFREVNPSLGTMSELADLARDLREQGISLVLDFVFNHTSDEHDWAQKALAGDPYYQAYYWMFPDRQMPDQYEAHLREIFPEQAPGSFTYRPEIQKWVWTTFYPFQWDLNYRNPEVFRAMLEEILFLANQGVEILRLDAVPFVWKQLGTPCENLPQVHSIIRALNGFVRIAAPTLLFKSEAIVHPRDVRSYIGEDKCQLSYNPIMMVAIWEALATRETDFFRHTMTKQFPLPEHTAWVNYIRSHDDIGWGFADEDAIELGIKGGDHRSFLNNFYTGRFPGSFAKGLPFNFNPRTGDMRISGTMASLAGLEQALNSGDPSQIEIAVRRILMIYAIILSAGGIPLIYLGDEIGTLNDYTYADDPATMQDNRWVHRPKANAEAYARRADPASIEGRIFLPLCQMIQLRKATPELAGNATRFIHTGNRHVLGYVRNQQVLVLANFSEQRQQIFNGALREAGFQISGTRDLISRQAFNDDEFIWLEPYQVIWLKHV